MAPDFRENLSRCGSQIDATAIQIHLDSVTGPLIGTCAVPNTGGWQTWTTLGCSLSGASGYHNVYLVFTGGGGSLFNLESFQFQY